MIFTQNEAAKTYFRRGVRVGNPKRSKVGRGEEIHPYADTKDPRIFLFD